MTDHDAEPPCIGLAVLMLSVFGPVSSRHARVQARDA